MDAVGPYTPLCPTLLLFRIDKHAPLINPPEVLKYQIIHMLLVEGQQLLSTNVPFVGGT